MIRSDIDAQLIRDVILNDKMYQGLIKTRNNIIELEEPKYLYNTVSNNFHPIPTHKNKGLIDKIEVLIENRISQIENFLKR